jgi:protein-S-isoprenylcysteine O-methyltransferase Ste14
MYLSTAEVLGMSIALASSIVLIVLTTIANYQIQKENKFLRTRLRVQRQYCQQQHAKVPF